MPRLKKSKCTEFLECIGANIRLCSKIYGTKKLSAVMGVSVSTVRNRIEKPSKITAKELFRLSDYIGAEPEDVIRPLKLGKGCEK